MHEFGKKLQILPQCKQMYVDHESTVRDLKQSLVVGIFPIIGEEGTPEKYRMWKLGPVHNIANLCEELNRMEISPEKYHRERNTLLQEYNCGLAFPGVSADFYPEAPIVRLFADSQFLVVEKASSDGEFVFKFARKVRPGVCPACNIYRTLVIACSCGKTAYCGEECQARDRETHSQVCPNVGIGDIYVEKKPKAKRGVVGLTNLGNTCYLNSALQCLSHTLELTRYFLEKRLAKEINLANKLGSGGELAQAYAKFIFSVWNDDQSVVAPHYVKKALTKFNPIVRHSPLTHW